MRSETREKLLNINRQFYERSAPAFSATRKTLQPGVRRLLAAMPLQADILDLGCGNGNFALALSKTAYSGSYLGVDSSEALLTDARAALAQARPKASFQFIQADLTGSGWSAALSGRAYLVITCFAVLHHIPDSQARAAFLRIVSGLLSPEGRLFLSVWQLFNNPRLKARLLPWDSAAIDSSDLEAGDCLMDWRAGNRIDQRYVHVFTPEELRALGLGAGLMLRDEFYSDGKTGNLALYQIWSRPS
ncbi:MAG TPA: class I SAM-dependent methyltransferase [Anaerolineaceae bacterium]|nr:class I SAM-dependent methyltransferase [Anaerolineaceae bacterium]HOT25657.1 class I SAM-dependent methyltransferase [Anaerolineaceae bacterium]HQH58268.1 class I SAM-dependent methyltransferase [Anaerolineaceae bacterium]HQK03287.1 class I SAM-dependent methyltransferase [Anaerolineaceae bacterium]